MLEYLNLNSLRATQDIFDPGFDEEGGLVRVPIADRFVFWGFRISKPGGYVWGLGFRDLRPRLFRVSNKFAPPKASYLDIGVGGVLSALPK